METPIPEPEVVLDEAGQPIPDQPGIVNRSLVDPNRLDPLIPLLASLNEDRKFRRYLFWSSLSICILLLLLVILAGLTFATVHKVAWSFGL